MSRTLLGNVGENRASLWREQRAKAWRQERPGDALEARRSS